MARSVHFECACGADWMGRVNLVDLGRHLEWDICPGCRLPGKASGRVADPISDPARQLRWTPSSEAPANLKRWLRLKLPDETDGKSWVITLRTEEPGWKVGYEVFVRNGKIVEALRAVGDEIERIPYENIPPHLIDLARSVALDGPVITDWQNWTQDALTAAKSGGLL